MEQYAIQKQVLSVFVWYPLYPTGIWWPLTSSWIPTPNLQKQSTTHTTKSFHGTRIGIIQSIKWSKDYVRIVIFFGVYTIRSKKRVHIECTDFSPECVCVCVCVMVEFPPSNLLPIWHYNYYWYPNGFHHSFSVSKDDWIFIIGGNIHNFNQIRYVTNTEGGRTIVWGGMEHFENEFLSMVGLVLNGVVYHDIKKE